MSRIVDQANNEIFGKVQERKVTEKIEGIKLGSEQEDFLVVGGLKEVYNQLLQRHSPHSPHSPSPPLLRRRLIIASSASSASSPSFSDC